MGICYSGFQEYDVRFDVWPYCGMIRSEVSAEPVALLPGTLLANRYLLGYTIGSGGFGIIYRAWDTKLETIVAVKEFFANRTRLSSIKNRSRSSNTGKRDLLPKQGQWRSSATIETYRMFLNHLKRTARHIS